MKKQYPNRSDIAKEIDSWFKTPEKKTTKKPAQKPKPKKKII